MSKLGSLEGQLLIASPHIGDPRFERTVVLLLQHDEEGAFGVILNRPLNESVRALWQKLGESSCRINQKLNLGGPVSGPLIALHDLESLSDFRVLPGLCVSEQKESIQQLVQLPDKPMRIYVGHAGWSAQQLEEEITEGAWHVMPARIEHVFCDSEYMWLAAMQEIGLAFYHEVLGIDYVPADVTMN